MYSGLKRKAEENSEAADLEAELSSFLHDLENAEGDPEADKVTSGSVGPSIGPFLGPLSAPAAVPIRPRSGLISKELARAEAVKNYNPDEPTESAIVNDEPFVAPAPVIQTQASPKEPVSQKKDTPKDEKKPKKAMRHAAGHTWEDNSLLDWPEGDFRIFCGDLGNDVSDDTLLLAFRKYPSATKAKVIRDKRTKKTKGFGFVSFMDPHDFIKALKEMNGKYCGNRPMKLRKSTWQDREYVRGKKDE